MIHDSARAAILRDHFMPGCEAAQSVEAGHRMPAVASTGEPATGVPRRPNAGISPRVGPASEFGREDRAQ